MTIFEDINAALQGQPDLVLSVILIGVGVACFVVAAWAPPALKLALASWVVMP